jgi:hypothetical protein
VEQASEQVINTHSMDPHLAQSQRTVGANAPQLGPNATGRTMELPPRRRSDRETGPAA